MQKYSHLLSTLFHGKVSLFKVIWKLVKIWLFKPDFKVKIWETKKKIGSSKLKEIKFLVK